MKIKKIVINPKKWLRGPEAGGDTKLLTEKGKMCCMGFSALAFGAKKKEIRGCGFWRSCENKDLVARDVMPGRPSYMRRFRKVYAENDRTDWRGKPIPDKERVARINKILVKMKENFRFVLGSGK